MERLATVASASGPVPTGYEAGHLMCVLEGGAFSTWEGLERVCCMPSTSTLRELLVVAWGYDFEAVHLEIVNN